MPSIIMLRVIMLSVANKLFVLSVVMLSVVAPKNKLIEGTSNKNKCLGTKILLS
jgi:hypothetical protein